jgi:FAD/FMN-containing dehydrogenase
MKDDAHLSWGHLPRVKQSAVAPQSRQDTLPRPENQTLLPRGLGRSYGDSCLNEGGTLVLTRGLDRFLSLDADTGMLEAEAGVSLADVLELAVPRGWFPPVTPGTQHVTLGGAVANDVHGKNHHREGTFGRHVLGFELLRSDGSRRWCSREAHATLFRATIGGLGLTGLITRVKLQLKRIQNPWIDEEQIRTRSLDEFFDLADASDHDHEYTVSWIDTLATGEALGRGIFMRGNHAGPGAPPAPPPKKPKFSVPLNAPEFLLNRASIRVFNTLYAHKVSGERHRALVPYGGFFYPLDVLGHWNRLYGKRGFFQHQCVVPRDGSTGPIRDILRKISDSGESSFLAVLKVFGNAPPEGLLSFPRPGVTLALDFPNRGPSTLRLMDELDEIVFSSGGALYPAKDARMKPEHFRKSFPALDMFTPHVDPNFSSSFYRRVCG